MIDAVATFLLTALMAWLVLSGLAFFVVGLLPGRSAAWYTQYGYSAVALTCAYYLFRLVFA